ncbi:MAG: hypothetical protein EA415_02360, partial [Sphaerobacteraceae bacterium]
WRWTGGEGGGDSSGYCDTNWSRLHRNGAWTVETQEHGGNHVVPFRGPMSKLGDLMDAHSHEFR